MVDVVRFPMAVHHHAAGHDWRSDLLRIDSHFPMTKPTCQTCRYFVAKPRSAVGHCHRYPNFRQFEQFLSDWCGEHEPESAAPIRVCDQQIEGIDRLKQRLMPTVEIKQTGETAVAISIIETYRSLLVGDPDTANQFRSFYAELLEALSPGLSSSLA